MKRIRIISFSLVLLLSACIPSFEKEEQVVQETEDKQQQRSIIPTHNISKELYRVLLPFKPSETRGWVSSNLYNRLDIDEFETGLFRIAQSTFDTGEYFYQPGKYISGETVDLWLKRKLTATEIEKYIAEDADFDVDKRQLALNPPLERADSVEEQHQTNPAYLSYILEQNFLTKEKGEEGKVHLGGVAIGLALKSVDYFTSKEGYPRQYEIPIEEIEKQGEQMAKIIVNRLRGMGGLGDVPIVIGLFAQQPRGAIVPGAYFASTVVEKGSSSIGKWKVINEKYYVFPSEKAKKDHFDDAQLMQNFKEDIEEYFPNYIGVIGNGFYIDDQLQQMNISIPIKFYGKAEVIGFSQYVYGLILEYFPEYISVQVEISSPQGTEALIVRDVGDKKPFVHIYQ